MTSVIDPHGLDEARRFLKAVLVHIEDGDTTFSLIRATDHRSVTGALAVFDVVEREQTVCADGPPGPIILGHLRAWLTTELEERRAIVNGPEEEAARAEGYGTETATIAWGDILILTALLTLVEEAAATRAVVRSGAGPRGS